MTAPYVRLARLQDEPVLYDICLRTGASGDDATELYDDRSLLGHIYVGPYLRHASDYAFAIEDAGGVAGYVLGAPDTRSFEAACERSWWPRLRERYARGAFPVGSPDARLVAMLHDPPVAATDVVAAYPAHLHIDLLPRLQGQGHGRRLMSTLFDRLAAADVAGVHLGVGATNHRAIAFYRKRGFHEVGREPGGLLMARQI